MYMYIFMYIHIYVCVGGGGCVCPNIRHISCKISRHSQTVLLLYRQFLYFLLIVDFIIHRKFVNLILNKTWLSLPLLKFTYYY